MLVVAGSLLFGIAYELVWRAVGFAMISLGLRLVLFMRHLLLRLRVLKNSGKEQAGFHAR
ncbi:MAG: hypothetical protein DMG21_22210 [Acidobacteria bacterium]|nr:MAG: hypothetical protein DMG21_22210 [Acidobacteriota bacterium]